MNKRIKIRNFNRLLAIIFVMLVFQLGLVAIAAQETKQEKCEKLGDCLQTFYRECYNEDYLDSFSPKLVEKFTSAITHEDEMSRLDAYLTELRNNSKATGYIVVYGGRTNKYDEYDIRVGRIERYIFGFKNQDKNRIKVINGGFREKFEFELWTSDIKNAFPPMTPTIAPEKVKFKGKMKPPLPGDSVM